MGLETQSQTQSSLDLLQQAAALPQSQGGPISRQRTWCDCQLPVSLAAQRPRGPQDHVCGLLEGIRESHPERPMVPLKPTLYVLPMLLAFLESALGWAGSQSCSVQEILRHYQAVIFQDLQAAMQWAGTRAQHTEPGSRHHHLTGAGGGQGQPGASCDAQKERSILLSIESLGQTLLGSVAGIPHNALEKAAWTVAVRTKAVMHRHCRTSSRILQPKRRPEQHRPSRRRLLLRALHAVATCWEKLFSLSAMATREF